MNDSVPIENTFLTRLFYSRKWLINHANDWKKLAMKSIEEIEAVNKTNRDLIAQVNRGEELIVKLMKEKANG